MKSGLFAFILLSALVHAVIIGVKDDWTFNIHDSHEQGGSSLDIELFSKLEKNKKTTEKKQNITPDKKHPPVTTLKSHKSKLQKKEKTITAKKSHHKTEISRLNTAKSTPEKSINSIDHTPASNTDNTPEKNTTNKSSSEISNANPEKNDNREKIKALLNNELSKHFFYPKAAQRKNRQGSVLLAFTISNQGEIKNIHINKSSGFKILDKAAIKALKEINANEDLAKALKGDSMEHTLPVTYKLTRY